MSDWAETHPIANKTETEVEAKNDLADSTSDLFLEKSHRHP